MQSIIVAIAAAFLFLIIVLIAGGRKLLKACGRGDQRVPELQIYK